MITIISCAGSFVLAFAFSKIFGFSDFDPLIISLVLMFSSTILVIKLLPTTALHHQRMGAVYISVFILGFGLLSGKLILLVSVLFIVKGLS